MINYIAVIHKDKGSEYGVSFPDFPGCITAGKTIDEAKDMAQEALQFHVEGILEDGEHMPDPCGLEEITKQYKNAVAYFVVSVTAKSRSIRINCTIDENLLEILDRKSQELGMTRSGFIAEAVRKELHI